MKEEDIALIDAYLAGELSEADKLLVEKRLQEDEIFAEVLSVRRKMDRYLVYHSGSGIKTKQIEALSEEYFAKSAAGHSAFVVFFRRYWIPVAATIAVLIAVLLLMNPFGSSRMTDEALYRRYAQHQPLDLSARGTQVCPEVNQLQTLFNEQQYQEALPMIERCLAVDPADLSLQLALGIAQLEIGNLDEAQSLFSELAAGNSLLQTEGLWYLALSELRKGDRSASRAYLRAIPVDTRRYETASSLLANL